MRWRRVKKPRDVIDQRGATPAGGRLGGGMSRLPVPGGLALPGGLGIVAVIVYIALQVLSSGDGGGFDVPTGFGPGVEAPGQPTPQGIPSAQDPERRIKDFSTYVFTDTQKSWEGTFRRDGEPYEHAQLILYSDAVNTGGCGSASSAVGPFYCPADQRVYLDLSFYEEMADQLGAPGDFAWAYVIAHEMGHHVQRETGMSDTVDRLSRENPDEANQL